MDLLRQAYFVMVPLFTIFLLGVTILILLSRYSSRKQRYWKERGIPYVKPAPFFESLSESMNKPFHIIDMDRFNKYGRIYGYYGGNQLHLSVAEPKILRNVFVKDFQALSGRRMVKTGDEMVDNALFSLKGEDWKRIRSIISPTFTTGKIKRMMGIFNECSNTLVKNFREESEKGKSIEVKSIYNAYIMDNIASTAFSTKIDSHNDPKNKFVTAAKQFFTTTKMTWRLLVIGVLFAFFPGILKFFRISFISPGVTKFFSTTVLQIIEERKRTGQTRNDFLQLLIDTATETSEQNKVDLNEKDDIAENYGKVNSQDVLKSYLSKKNLSHEELVAQCVAFFVAGFEVTTTTLSFASYSLALNPDIQERLIQEVDGALSANDGKLTYEGIQSMKYLDNLIAETLRIYPPLVRLERVAEEDWKLDDTGLTLPKGTVITIPIYSLHRDPELFPNPEKFDPDRFSPEERNKQVPYSYLPFSAGPRNCVAMRFALIQLKVCLAHVLSNFRIKKCPTTKVPLEYNHGLGFLQPKSISLFMEIRKDSVKEL